MSKKYFRYMRKILPWKWFLKLITSSLKTSGNHYSDQTVLCIGRAPFDKDFDELAHRVRDYSWVWLDNEKLNIFLKKLLPKRCQTQTFYQKTLISDRAQWNVVTERTRYLLQDIQSKFNVCCVLSANIDYWQDHGFKVICKELGLPFIVLAKEFPINDFVRQKYRDRYADYVTDVDAVAVFGESLKKLYHEIGVVDESKVTVTGAPRLDRWREIEPSSKKDRLVLLSFREGYGGQSGEQFFQLLGQLTRKYRSFGFKEFFVKSKNPRDSKMIRQFCEDNKVRDVITDDNVPLYDLIPQSAAVICFNSLSVVEAMLSDTEILVPDWIDVKPDEKMLDANDPVINRAVRFFGGMDEMSQFLSSVGGVCEPVSSDVIEARSRCQEQFWEFSNTVSASRKVQGVLTSLIKPENN